VNALDQQWHERCEAAARAEGAAAGMELDRVVSAPDWLYCTEPRWAVLSGWAAVRPPPCAVLHLVQLRLRFGGDAKKADRPYVTRALGHWHHPEADADGSRGEAGGGDDAAVRPGETSGAGDVVRAVELAPEVLECAAKDATTDTLRSSLRLLFAAAVVLRRAPVVPRVPCGSRWIRRDAAAAGAEHVADERVLKRASAAVAQAGGAGAAPPVECHLAIGGRECDAPTVVPAWELRPGEQAVEHLQLDLPQNDGARGGCSALAVAQLRASHARGNVAPPLLRLSASPEITACALDAALTSEEAVRLETFRTRCDAFFQS
jgi:hypothetical protein